MNDTRDDNTLLCSQKKREVVVEIKERTLSSSETRRHQFISQSLAESEKEKKAVDYRFVSLEKASDDDDSSVHEPHLLSLGDDSNSGDAKRQHHARHSPTNDDTDDAFVDLEVEIKQEARLGSDALNSRLQSRSGAFVVTGVGDGSSNDGSDDQTTNSSAFNRTIAARLVNRRDLDRIVAKRTQQALMHKNERERAAVAQIALENAEFSSPQEASDNAEKISSCDPRDCVIPCCITVCGPRGRLFCIGITSAVFGTAAILVAIIYVATKD